MENKKYFRIEPFWKLPKIGEICNTDLMFDQKRIDRFNELSVLFELFYLGSVSYNLPVAYFFDLVHTRNYFKLQKLKKTYGVDITYINHILKENKKCHFRLMSEGRYFFDYILEIARVQLSTQLDKTIPDRFKSKFFFKSLEDCHLYMKEKGQGKIIEVEILECVSLSEVDNRLLNHFENQWRSIDLMNQAMKALLGEVSNSPLIEIVFQGKYRVLSYK